MNPFKLFFPSYLFDPTPGDSFLYAWPLMIFFLLLFSASWKVHALIKNSKNPRINKELLGALPGRMREFGFIGAVLVFLRAENIPYLGMRVWLLLWLLLMLAYGIRLYLTYKKQFAVKVMEKKARTGTDKYLPGTKKKKKKKSKKRRR